MIANRWSCQYSDPPGGGEFSGSHGRRGGSCDRCGAAECRRYLRAGWSQARSLQEDKGETPIEDALKSQP